MWSDRVEQDLLRAVRKQEAYRTARGVSRRWISVRDELRANGAFGGREVPNWKTLRTKTEKICDSRRSEVASAKLCKSGEELRDSPVWLLADEILEADDEHTEATQEKGAKVARRFC